MCTGPETELRDPDQRLLFADALRFEPINGEHPNAIGLLANHDALATLYVISRRADPANIVGLLRPPLADCPDVLAGVSELPNGCGASARLLGPDSNTVKVAMATAWNAVRTRLIGASARPPRRSRSVRGPSRHFDRKPSSLSFEEAAAMPLSGLTAWQALVQTANVRPGQRVFVSGESGAVGASVVQIAHIRRAYAIGIAKASAHDALRRLGADELIDYTAARFEDAVDAVDLVIDLDLTNLVDRGLLTANVGALLCLEDASRAHQLAESHAVDGKIVLSVYR
jgi:hypothetical protein